MRDDYAQVKMNLRPCANAYVARLIIVPRATTWPRIRAADRESPRDSHVRGRD